MQVIYIMGVFMFVFSIIMGLTTTLTRSAMQHKLDSIAVVHQIFQDVENGINNGILANQADLRHLHNQFRNGQNNRFGANVTTRAARDALYAGRTDLDCFPTLGRNVCFGLLDYVNWSLEELTSDPWGRDYRVYYSTERDFLETGVQAPVTTFAFISSGPNGAFEAGSTLATISRNNITSIEPSAGSDDIIAVFSTKDAVIRTWAAYDKAIKGVIGLVQADYTEQYVGFLPNIEAFNEAQFSGSGFGFDNVSLNAWQSNAGLIATSGYPQIQSNKTALGASIYTDGTPLIGGANTLFNRLTIGFVAGSFGHRANINFNITPTGSSTFDWRVNQTREVDGRAVISN